MATDNNDIFPEDITKMLEKMDKTIEENSSNLNADVQITVHTNSDNTDINNSFINLNKQIDDTLDSLDRRVDQHKGAFDIWKTFGVELDTESFGSDDANKDRTDKDAVYDQLALLAKVLNKNPKLLGTLTSLNGKNLKLVLGDFNNRADYLNRADKLVDLESGIITTPQGYDKNTDTLGFTGQRHNIIAAPKQPNQTEFEETIFHEYGHRILNKILKELNISHAIQGETVTEFINRLKQMNTFASATEIQDNALNKFLIGQLDQDKFNDIFEHPEKYQKQPNPKINTIIKLFENINNSPELLNHDKKDKNYVNDVDEVFARSFANFMSSMSDYYSKKRVNSELYGYNVLNTRHYNTDIHESFLDFFDLLGGENLIGGNGNLESLFTTITKRKFKGLNSTEMTNYLVNILNHGLNTETVSKLDDDAFLEISNSVKSQLNVLYDIFQDNHIDLTKYKFSPTNIYKIFNSSFYKNSHSYFDEDENEHLVNQELVHDLLGAKTPQDVEKLKKLETIGRTIQRFQTNTKMTPTFRKGALKLVHEYLKETGYDVLSKEEIDILNTSISNLPPEYRDNQDIKNLSTSLDAAMKKIPTSDVDKNEKSEDKLKQECCCLNSFADSFKSITDSFKNHFESAIESTANYFKKVFESALVSYGDILARARGGKNPITEGKFFTGDYNPSIVDKNESRIGTPFVTKDGRTLYSKKVIDEYIKPYQQASNQFYTENKDVIETIYGNKTEPLMLGYDPSSTFEYNINQYPNDIKQVLSLSDRTSDIQHWRSSYTSNGKKTYEPVIEDAVIIGNSTVGDDTFNRAIRKASFVNPNAPLMLGYDKHQYFEDSNTIVANELQDIINDAINQEASSILGYTVSDGLKSNDSILSDLKTILSEDNKTSKVEPNEFETMYANALIANLNKLRESKVEEISKLEDYHSKLAANFDILDIDTTIEKILDPNTIHSGFRDAYDLFPDIVKQTQIGDDANYFTESYVKTLKPQQPLMLEDKGYRYAPDAVYDDIKAGMSEAIIAERNLKIDNLADLIGQKQNIFDDTVEDAVIIDDNIESVKNATNATEEFAETVKEATTEIKNEVNKGVPGFIYQDYTKTGRKESWVGERTGFNLGDTLGKHRADSTKPFITFEKDKEGEIHYKIQLPPEFKNLKEMMDLNEQATHMQKHLEDYWRFQWNNPTNPELTPLEYLNIKYAERADYLKQRMENTSTGFASTIYKIGGQEHTYQELLSKDTVLTQKMAEMNNIVEQIKHANDIIKDENGNETGKSMNPLETYRLLRQLSELEKDIKKRTANAIKEQQTIYKELSDISKEGEKIADEGIKQADKMLAGDSTYKSIFGKYKIPELSRSGKFRLTSEEYQKVLGIEDIIKTKKELLKDDTLKKDAREKLRNEIKNLNKQLDDYTTGQIADRAKAVSGIEDDYNSRVKPALTTLNKTFGNIFNTNADIDYENIRRGGISKIKEWSKYINLDNIFNINNVKRYASELSKNISTMFTSGIRMFESAFSKISSIIGKVIKTVTIAITGAVATVTAAITGFVAGFTAMGKSIVSATDVYRKQTIALSGVYQSPTKTNRMINTVYDVTRSMPINYTQAVQTLSEMSAIPALQTILKSNDTQKSDQLMTKMFKVITAMTTMRPDQRSSDAIFSLRNAFAGDLRSLQRRFDLPTANIMNVKGTMGLAAVKTDPMALLDSLENYFDSFLDVGTINKISDTISIITEKIKGAIDLFKANIGNAGFYELVAKDFRKIRDVVVNYVTSADGKTMAKRLSDVFGNVYESVKSIAYKLKDIVSNIFNIDIKTLPELFVKGLEFFAKSVNYLEKLLNVKDVTKFVKELIQRVVDSKDIVLGYIDDIKNKFIDIISPVLKFGSIVMDVTNDIVNALKKTGLSDKGIIYLWLLGPSNVLNMTIAGIGVINAAVKLLITTTGVLYYTLSGLYGLLKPMLAMVTASLSKILIPIGAVLAKVLIFATIGDLIYSNWNKLQEVFDPILTIVNTLISTTVDGFELIGTVWNSIWDIDNLKNTVVAVTDLVSDGIRLGLAKAAQYIPGLSFITNMGDPNIAFENAKNDFSSHLEKNHFVSDDVKQSFKQFWESVKAMPEIIKEGFKPWTTPSKYEWNSGHIIPYIKNKVNNGLNWTGDKIISADKYISSIPQKIEKFFNWLISDSNSDSDILNNSNKTLGFIKNSLDYIVNNIKTKSTSTIGKTLDNIVGFTSKPITSITNLINSTLPSKNPLNSIISAITGTSLNSYEAPYESPNWNKRLNSMAMEVERLQFQRGSIWSKDSKSDKSEKMFKTDYGDFGAFGLQTLNTKKLDNLVKINELVNEISNFKLGKIKLNEADTKEFEKIPEQLENAKRMTAEIDNLIRDNIEASVMLIQESLGSASPKYLKNDVMQFVMSKQRQFNSQLEQDIGDSIRLQYAVYFATTDEFDGFMNELRKKYHDVNDMYADISKGNVNFSDISELGKQIITEFAKRYEAEREYLWNLEKQREYIEVTNKNINKMGLGELSENWSNLMNSPYKKVREAAGNQYMNIMKEDLEQDSIGSMVRKVRDIAINSFTDMKNAIINAVQEIVKSTQQTIKNGLDKLISDGGTVKPMFKELFENIKKNFFGIYTNEAANKLTEFIYGSSFEDNKTQDPMIKLDTDIKDFNTSVLQKMDEVIASNEKFLNDAFNKWLEENNKSKQETPLYRGSAYIVEKQGSNLAPLESVNNDISTVVGITAEEFARNAKAVAENTNTVNECAKGYRKNLDTFAGGVEYAGKKLFGFDDNIIDANDYYRALQNNKNFDTVKLDETKSLLSQLKVGDTLSWWNGKRGKEDIQQHVGVYVGNGQLASDHIEDMKNRDWVQWRLESGYGMPQVSRLATSKTVEKPISSIDNNVTDIKNDIRQIVNGTNSSIRRSGYSQINAPTINNIISGTSEGFNLNGLLGGINIPSGIADLGKRAGFGVIGSAIGKASGLSSLKSLFGSKSLNLSSIPLLSASSKGNKLTSLKLTGAGANAINSAIGMAGGLGVDISGVINEAIKSQTPLKGIWGELFGTIENVESKFGGASIGSLLGNMMSGKGLVDSLGAVALKTFGKGTDGAKMIAGSNTLTKGLTGLTSTLFGKSAGQSVAKFLGKSFLGTTVGTALPIIGTVAKVLSGKGWFGGAKDRTAEGRARGAEFNALRDSLVANRNTIARNYYMANDDTLDALRNYEFGTVAMWTSKRGHKWNGTKRRIMNTDATAFTNSMKGYWDLLQKATEQANNNQRKLDKLANINNLEALRQTGAKESTRLASIANDLAKYKAAVSRYAGHDTGFTQTLFDGQSYTMTQLNDKVQDLIKELGDSKNAIDQNTEAIRQEKLVTADAKLDYETALYGKYNPLISYQNEIQKLNNEWNSVMNDDGTIGYKEGTKEWYQWNTKMLQATDNLEEATKQLEESAKQFKYDVANNWVSTLTQIRKSDGTYNASQVKNIADAYRKKVAVDSVGNSLESIMSGLNPTEMTKTEVVKEYAGTVTNKTGMYKNMFTGKTITADHYKTLNWFTKLAWSPETTKKDIYKDVEYTYTGTSPIKEGAVTELYNTLKNYNKSVKNEADKIDISKYINTKKATTTTLYDLSTGKFNEAKFNNDIKKALNTTEGKNALMSLDITADTSFKSLSDKYNAALKANPTKGISGYYTGQQYRDLLKKEGASLRAYGGGGYNGKIYVYGSIADPATKKKNIKTANTEYLNAIQAAGYSKKSGVLTQKDGMYLFNAGGDVGNYQLFKFTKDQANQFTQIMFGKTVDAYMDYTKKTTVTVDNMSLKNGIKLSDLFKLVDAGVMKYSELLGKELEHQIAMAKFENVVDDIKQNITSVMSHTTTSAMDTIKANLKNIKDVNKNSKNFLNTGDYEGYDDFMERVIQPLVQNIGGEMQNIAGIYEQAFTSGLMNKKDATGAMAHMNDFMQKLEDAQYAYIFALESGNSQDAKEAEKTLNELLSANSTYFKNLKNDYSNITKLVYQSNAKNTILGSISGFEDYDIANSALKEFNSTLGKNAMNKLLGVKNGMTEFTDANMSKWFGVSGEDPYETYYEWQKKTILQRIKNEKEGSEEWYQAELDLWNLMNENAKYLKEKAEKTSQTIEDMLGKIEETVKTRVAEEAKSSKGDFVYIDMGATRKGGEQYARQLLNSIKTDDPEAQKLIKEVAKKLGVK